MFAVQDEQNEGDISDADGSKAAIKVLGTIYEGVVQPDGD